MVTQPQRCWALGRDAGDPVWIQDASAGPGKHVVATGERQPRDLLCRAAVREWKEEEAVASSGATETDVHLPGICWGIFLPTGCECSARQSHLPATGSLLPEPGSAGTRACEN